MNSLAESSVKLLVDGREIWLLPQKAVYIPSCRLLLIADMHVGKSNHFRRHGVAVTSQVFEQDFRELELLLGILDVDRVFFLGDLFHSDPNAETFSFLTRLETLGSRFFLIPGNHDRYTPGEALEKSVVMITEPLYSCDGFLFVHEWLPEYEGSFSFSGHVHPAIRLSGGYSSVTVPAFIHSPNNLLLPAFSRFTGNKVISRKQGLKVFPVSAGKVWRV